MTERRVTAVAFGTLERISGKRKVKLTAVFAIQHKELYVQHHASGTPKLYLITNRKELRVGRTSD